MKMLKNMLTMLLCVVLASCLVQEVFAEGGVSIEVEAAAVEVKAGDTVDYTVYLCGADTLDGGVWAYEFVLEIPEGLSFVSGSGNVSSAAIRGFIMPAFNETTKKCTSGMGAIGEGFTGAKVPLLTFRCKVENGEADKLTISLVKTLVGNREGKRTEHTAVNETISLHAHVGSEPVFHWSENGTCTVTYRCGVDGCGEEITKTADVTAQAADATCTSAGKVTYSAVFEMDGKTYKDTKTMEGAVAPHSYEAEFRWKEDSGAVDVTLRCGACGKTVEVDAADVIISVKNDTAGAGVIYEATAVVDGREYTATKTGKKPDADTDVPGLIPEEPIAKEGSGWKAVICAVTVVAVAAVVVVLLRKKKAKQKEKRHICK